MSVVLTARNISKTFGTRALFASVSLSLEQSERMALIGPNGSGKSTLLKIIAGLETADSGEVIFRKGARVAYVPQADEFPPDVTMLQAVIRSMLDSKVAHVHDEHEAEIEALQLLDRLGFDDVNTRPEQLSGGQRKRLAIGCRLATDPDVLMLDEPTNHLDMEGVEWLEDLLAGAEFGSIFITHDRFFLESAATRIVELSRSYPEGTFAVEGDYSEFLRRKQEFLDGQVRQQQSLANQVREDLRWLSRGAQARRTKSKSRAAAAHSRIEELAVMKERTAGPKVADIEFSGTGRQTRKLIEARMISKSMGGKALFKDLSLVLSPGSKLGLLGPNGSGKTTLLKVLQAELPPDPASAAAIEHAKTNPAPPSAPPPGGVGHADKLRIVVFSQHRTEIDPSITLRDAISPHSDSVIYNGRTLHVNTWAQKFLFHSEQLKAPVRALSGGERARIHIATLMLKEADVLILDEPTNDLDIPSLEVLESSLEEFPGAVMLVTHDRAMLARLATEIVALDGKGNARKYVSYSQWEADEAIRRRQSAATPHGSLAPAVATAPLAPQSPPAPPKPSKRKLTYNEQRELAGMEAAITAAEAEVARIEGEIASSGGDRRAVQDRYTALGVAQAKVAALFERWAFLQGE